MVSTPLKNITQNRNLHQIGVKIKHIWNHHLVIHKKQKNIQQTFRIFEALQLEDQRWYRCDGLSPTQKGQLEKKIWMAIIFIIINDESPIESHIIYINIYQITSIFQFKCCLNPKGWCVYTPRIIHSTPLGGSRYVPQSAPTLPGESTPRTQDSWLTSQNANIFYKRFGWKSKIAFTLFQWECKVTKPGKQQQQQQQQPALFQIVWPWACRRHHIIHRDMDAATVIQNLRIRAISAAELMQCWPYPHWCCEILGTFFSVSRPTNIGTKDRVLEKKMGPTSETYSS